MAVHHDDPTSLMFLPTSLWKYVDDTTISETISKNQDSHIQAAFDTLVNPRFLGKVSTKRDEMQGTVHKL